MKELVIILAGRANVLMERIREEFKIEDFEYFLSGVCNSLMGGYDEEWEGFVEDSRYCIEILTILHTRYRDLIIDYLNRSTLSGHDGFEVSIQDVPEERINVLLVKSFPVSVGDDFIDFSGLT